MVFGLKLGLARDKKAPAPSEPPQSDGHSGHVPSSKATSGGKSALTVNEFVARTKKSRERGVEPTKPELIAYARYLGIDPVIDADLMWIVDESLNAPLPSEWTEHHDSAGRVFYYNVHTHTSSWTHPLEQLHRDTYKTIVNFRSGDLTKDEQAKELEQMRRKCEDDERDAHKELQAWTEHVDDQGQKFYNNRDQQRSYWTDPRPARCHTLYLQMKALRCLSKHCGQHVGSQKDGLKSLELGRIRADLPRGDHPSSSVQDAEDSKAEKRRRKKEKKDREAAEAGNGRGREELAPLGRPNRALDSDDDSSLPTPTKDPFQKRPNRNAVEEVRQAIGVSDNALPPLGVNSNRGFGMGGGRLGTPPGDGLTSQGRARVKPGIKLEPIQALS